MENLEARIAQFCKTLPISFYCKRKIECDLTQDEMSAYDAFNDKLHISINQIVTAVKNAGDITEEELEMLCRSNFYHEVSHAILTPERLIDCVLAVDYDWQLAKSLLNVFEDERIETLLNKFYINVDFKRSLIAMNGDAYFEEPTSAFKLFYKVVRFRNSPKQEWLGRVNQIIAKHRSLSRANAEGYEVRDYADDIGRLWKEIKRWWDEEQKVKQQSKQKQTEQADLELKSNGSQQEADQHSDSLSNVKSEEKEETKQVEQAEMTIEEAIAAAEKEVSAMSAGKNSIDEIISETFTKNKYEDAALLNALQKIVFSSKLSAKRNAAAINGWSGVIDPRLCDREDKRFFVQKSRAGHLKQHSKLHLTFYQDISGSYTDDVKPTNDLFYALQKLEQDCQDFTFDVVAINTFINVLPRSKREIRAYGGTSLSPEIFKIVRQMHKPDAVNKSIVLFDGGCNHPENFKAFDSSDFIIIYEWENEQSVDKYCPNARKIKVEGDFAENLKDVAVTAIETALR